MTPSDPAPDLSGVTVALLRNPERASEMAAELGRRGARVLNVPLIDWELPADTSTLDDRLRAASTYDWVLLTSVTTVRVLAQRAEALGFSLPVLLAPARVAAVGAATQRELERVGVVVDLVPEQDQSAVGLLSVLPEGTPRAGTPRALLPQSEIAADTLRAGLADRGWTVDAVSAYATVDYPAAADLRIKAPHTAEPSDSHEPDGMLSSGELAAGLRGGAIDAVVLTSPSVAGRLHAMMGQLPGHVATAAIGRRTAQDAAKLGLRIDAVASMPGPAGIADAVAAAVAHQRKKR
ncbi:uroporphyrinogen-III synthase [Arthrobacter sp. JZ12]|uniref:uroporphyrinogen-III synthase n=1 Tax=Arthrobacter sp. JZ12 TaxID=2654190 RepID=UPI002B47F76B|nr:uroporphyrinogen-III synthase [Arthrobacter sp. JZ12]WRH25450.1 uroporphyrinogen-III synthase [Arthrobacter sp. JZ12]